MAIKKELTNLMPARAKKILIKNIKRTFNSNFSQTFYRIGKSYFKNYQKKWLGVILKVCSLKTSNFWPPPPLLVPVPFTCTRTLNVLSLYSVTTPLKKSSATIMNFRMKNQWVKTEKRINFLLTRKLKD